MKLGLLTLLALGAVAVAEDRARRQVNYQFPGPRQGQAGQPAGDPSLYQQQPRPQYQAQQPVQSYAAAGPRAAAPAQSYGVAPQQAPPRRPAAPSRTRYADSQQDVEEQPEDQGPDQLTLLLQDSKFSCGSKKDGYYADNSVNCQAFHYCVAGAKHSWMCPQGTLFHQVHLNCVPNNQDSNLCGQAEKFYFVNDYLHKELESRGPNNSIQYAQRYYPDGYTIGDSFVAPAADSYQQGAPQQARPQPGGYGPAPAQYRPQGPPPPPQPQHVPQQYAPAGRPSFAAAGPPPQPRQPAYAPSDAGAPPARAGPPPQSYGYAQAAAGGAPSHEDPRLSGLPSLPQIPQQQYQPQPQPQPQVQFRRPQSGPAPNLASRTAAVQPYGGAYQASGSRQVRYDDDKGY